MKATGDQQLIKRINRSLLLRLMRARPGLSRAQLAGASGLTKSTVSLLARELLDEGWAREAASPVAAGLGRPATPLFINAEVRALIGIEIGVACVRVVGVSLLGTLLGNEEAASGADSDTRARCRQAALLARRVERSLAERGLMLSGIGVGVPGAVDDASGIVRFAPNLGWRDLDLLPILAEAFADAGLPEVPIHLRNEAHVAALGEYEFGGIEGDGPLVFVSCDVGVGAGVILDDGLFGGAQGMAGEIGHTVIQIDGPLCSCGRRGCAEAFLGERALAGRGAMERAGTYLGVLLQNLWVAFNPRRIVLGGSSCVRNPTLLDAARATLAAYGESAGIPPPEVQAARDGLLAPAVGAAALTLHSELRPLHATSVVPPQPRGSGTKPGKGSGTGGRRHGRGMTPLASRFSTLS